MMGSKKLGPWQLECDPEKTRALYLALRDGSREVCGCAVCRNFRALGTDALAPGVRELLLDLGIDPTQPAELYQAGPSEAGGVPYAGFYHFVGQSLTGDHETAAEAEAGFRYFIIPTAQLVPNSSSNEPLLQLEFEVPLPWVLAEACPQ